MLQPDYFEQILVLLKYYQFTKKLCISLSDMIIYKSDKQKIQNKQH